MDENNPEDTISSKTIDKPYQNNQLSAEFYNNLPVAVYTCDAVGYVTSFNNAAAKLWGRSPEICNDLWCGSFKIYNLKGEPILPDMSPMARTLKQGVAITGEEIIIERTDGVKTRVKTYPVPTFNSAGILTGAVNTLINIAEVTDSEEKQAMLAAIVGSSDDTIISKTMDGVITSWNKAAQAMFGYTEEEAIGKHISLLIPSTRIQEEAIIIGNIAKGNKIDHFETIRLAKDGREIPISLSVSPIMDSRGKIIGASKIARDISDRYKTEEKQAILAAIVDTSDDTILSKTLDGIITSWNKAAEKMFGYTQDEILGKHISILIPPSRIKEEEYIISQIAQGNRVDHFETIRVTKQGKEIAISLSVSPIKNSSGKVIGASKIARDISSQKIAEETSKRYTERLEVINNIVKLVSEELDLNKILQKVIDATTQLTRAQFGAFYYNKVDASGESLMLYTLSGAPREAFDKFGMPHNTVVFDSIFSGQAVVRVNDITKDPRYGLSYPDFGMPEGYLPVISYMAVPVVSRSGTVIGGLFFGHPEPGMFTKEHEDLVVPIAAQAAIGLDNAKLYEEVKALNEKKDEFIGLASHELKTPLTSITGYLQILDRSKSDDSRGKFVTKTIQQVKKLTALVSDLLDVSKIEAGKLHLLKESFDIRFILDDAIELIQHSHNTHEITLKTNIDSLQVYGDPHRIEQVIINLLTNAIKYSYSANKVEVTLSSTDTEVKIEVKDYGIGIAPEKFAHLFSRFYRVEELNPNVSGLGIGLYISNEIINRHDGKLWVDSEPDKGSTFWFTIPV